MNFVLLIIGLALLIKGVDLFVGSASKLAGLLGVPLFIVGISVVAFGTSAPEAAIGIFAGIKGANQITLGDVIGSSITNITLILGLAAIIQPIKVAAPVVKREIPISFFIQTAFALMLFTGLILSRFESIILLVGFLVFIIYLGLSSKELAAVQKAKDSDEQEARPDDDRKGSLADPIEKAESKGKLVLLLLLGLAALVLGSNLTVDSAVAIAQTLGLSDRFIGLTIIALGTSLPELVTCLVAAFRKEEGIAVGNIIGSNIFNILFVMGLSSSLAPIVISPDVFLDIGFMIFTTVLLFIPSFLHKKISRLSGILFVGVYLLYMAYKIVGAV